MRSRYEVFFLPGERKRGFIKYAIHHINTIGREDRNIDNLSKVACNPKRHTFGSVIY